MEEDTIKFLSRSLEWVKQCWLNVRVMKNNGEMVGMITEDFNPGRLNVEVKDGLVIKAYWG